ncbi:hypothetical protein TIFTF001_027144 [Ficus carica]|uniref:Uncharacterized protein n=1 Tax=Ficus carica TaxID=3494 RepID=A0AA88DMH1_FICCA|nr:hypothetical protein TIFTF001_027144 [Ficus carica]
MSCRRRNGRRDKAIGGSAVLGGGGGERGQGCKA